MKKILGRIKDWREENWDGTLAGHMSWCKRGAGLHQELMESLSQFNEAKSKSGDCPFKETCATPIYQEDFIAYCQDDDAFVNCFYYPSQVPRKIPSEWDEK